jgi:hypothetical protein
MYSLIRIYLWATSLWVPKCFPITILPYWCFCIEQVYPVPCLVLIHSKPCRHDLTWDLVYPSWSIIQTNSVFDRVWGSFQPRSLYPGRRCPLSTTSLQEVILDSEHLTELLGQEDRVMKHSSILQWCHVAHSWKGKSHGRLRSLSSFQLSRYSISFLLFGQCIVHRFLCSPSYRNLRMRFLLRGEGCNTPCYGKLNQST